MSISVKWFAIDFPNAIELSCYCRLENLKTCYELITKHGVELRRALSELESNDDIASKNKIVSERATLFRISSNAMINVSCTIYLSLNLHLR